MKIDPEPPAPVHGALARPILPAGPSPESSERWSWLCPSTWLDDITVPPWAPEGDPSLAARVRDP